MTSTITCAFPSLADFQTPWQHASSPATPSCRGCFCQLQLALCLPSSLASIRRCCLQLAVCMPIWFHAFVICLTTRLFQDFLFSLLTPTTSRVWRSGISAPFIRPCLISLAKSSPFTSRLPSTFAIRQPLNPTRLHAHSLSPGGLSVFTRLTFITAIVPCAYNKLLPVVVHIRSN